MTHLDMEKDIVPSKPRRSLQVTCCLTYKNIHFFLQMYRDFISIVTVRFIRIIMVFIEKIEKKCYV